jgi:hypothetical protein
MGNDLDRQIEDHEHAWQQVDTIPWETQFPDLNERFHTVVYRCGSDQCDAKRWAREERDQTQATDWL